MTIEVTAKSVEEAVSQGLKQLDATLDQVTVEVVNAGGLFRKAKVRITLEGNADKSEKTGKDEKPAEPKKAEKAEKPVEPKKAEKPEKPVEPKAESAKQQPAPAKQPKAEKSKQVPKPKAEAAKPTAGSNPKEGSGAQATERAVTFVNGMLEKMGFTEYTVQAEGENIAIDAKEGDDSLIIGRHGETLSAISYLAEMSVRAEKLHANVVVDCNGYRGRRAASLTAMARRRANECAAKRRKIKLEPMERIDRRTIHTALGDDERVTTASEGKEPYRYVVIFPRSNRDKKPSAE